MAIVDQYTYFPMMVMVIVAVQRAHHTLTHSLTHLLARSVFMYRLLFICY